MSLKYGELSTIFESAVAQADIGLAENGRSLTSGGSSTHPKLRATLTPEMVTMRPPD
jgi:phage tail protein X